MIASLKICAAVHGTVDDNMAVNGIGGDNEEEPEGKGGQGEACFANCFGSCWTRWCLQRI